MKTYFTSKPNLPIPEIKGEWQFLKFPNVIAQIKIDGEMQFLVSDGTGYGTTMLINKYGRVREDLPITKELAKFKGVLAGELYYNTGKSFFDEMLSNKFSSALKFMVFDVLQYGDAWVNDKPYEYRRSLLETLTATEHINIAEQYLCKDRPAVEALFTKVTAQGYEGLVVKNLTSLFVDGTCQSMMKLKKINTADVLCIGVRKDKDSIVIGTQARKPIGAVGHAGKEFYNVLAKIKAQKQIAEDKENFYVDPIYTIEVSHLGILKSGMLRNAVFVKTRELGKEVSL